MVDRWRYNVLGFIQDTQGNKSWLMQKRGKTRVQLLEFEFDPYP